MEQDNGHAIVWLTTGQSIILRRQSDDGVSQYIKFITTDIDDHIAGGTNASISISRDKILFVEPISDERYSYLRSLTHRNHQMRDVESQLRFLNLSSQAAQVTQAANQSMSHTNTAVNHGTIDFNERKNVIESAKSTVEASKATREDEKRGAEQKSDSFIIDLSKYSTKNDKR